MRIGIDARLIGIKRRGIGRYVNELLKSLAEIENRDEFFIFTSKENFKFVPDNFQKIETNVPWYGYKEQLIMPRLFKKITLDLVHIPHWNAPLRLRTPYILTIHDLILWQYPTLQASTLTFWSYILKYSAFRFLLPRLLEGARHIIAVSESTRKEIIENLKIKSQNVTAVPLGISPLAKETKNFAPKPYLLIVSSGYPHKNLETAFRAAAELLEKDALLHFVVVGLDNAFAPKIKITAKKIMAEKIKRTFFYNLVSEKMLSSLYANAEALISTSVAEGFSLPPLEALSMNIPVVVSDIPVHRENLKESALYAKPNDYKAFVKAIRTLQNDQALKQKLLNAGKARVNQFSWRSTALKTLEIYHQVGKNILAEQH